MENLNSERESLSSTSSASLSIGSPNLKASISIKFPDIYANSSPTPSTGLSNTLSNNDPLAHLNKFILNTNR
jgi:hypothetical protein